MRTYFALILFFASTTLLAQRTVESIPNQKLIDNSYVSNPDGVLDEATVAHINAMLGDLEQETTVQVAVVAVQSIGDVSEVDFAQELFDKWGIGKKGNDNGLLILLAAEQRVVRFHTGLGVEGALPDATCKKIQRDHMVPEFRNGNLNAGMIQGVDQVKRVLTDPAYAEELKAPETDEPSDPVALAIFLSFLIVPTSLIMFIIRVVNKRFSNSKHALATPYPEMRLSSWTWLLLFAFIPVALLFYLGTTDTPEATGFALLGLYLYFMATLITRLWRMKQVINRLKANSDFYEITVFLRKEQWYWLGMAVIFPFPFLLYFFYHLARKRLYRNHPRNCKLCNSKMEKLDETADDQFLTKAQLMEENLRSVDYDVWQCTSCRETESWNYPNRFSKYKECPSCKTFAYYLASSRTITHATYTSSGRGEQTHTCKFCGKSKTTSYTIAQLTRSTSSSGSSGSSSGGSWGGGRSGGGGASSRW